MKARLDILCLVISRALDLVEEEMFDTRVYHSLRIAVLCAAIARQLGLTDEDIAPIVVSALFHDSALTEWNLAEREGKGEEKHEYMQLHCRLGQRNLDCLPINGKVDGFILYHHESLKGDGPFKRSEGQFPLGAELLSATDYLDMTFHLGTVPTEDLAKLHERLRSWRSVYFSEKVIDAFLAILDVEMLNSLKDEQVNDSIHKAFPPWSVDTHDPVIIRISEMIAHIIDYKSVFTKKHTIQIANRVYVMAEHYGYDDTKKCQLYLAAALHDIGKVAIPLEVLEKPGKLDAEEFAIIQKHVWHTWDWLSRVEGFEDICRWASSHHEKLDGSGYPFGRTVEELDFNSRLMACIDIYQAVSEERPYHAARSHEQTMEILKMMADEGRIDTDIVTDLDEVMAPYSLKDVPLPAVLQRFDAECEAALNIACAR